MQQHCVRAQERCGYPSWTINKVKEQQSQKEKTNKSKKRKEHREIQRYGHTPVKGMVTLQSKVWSHSSQRYGHTPVKGATEPIQRIIKHQEIATSVRPHQNVRRILVHPKDKVEEFKIVQRQTVYIRSLVRAVTTHVFAKQGEHLEQD